jgi:hypothetical protein
MATKWSLFRQYTEQEAKGLLGLFLIHFDSLTLKMSSQKYIQRERN